MKLFNFKNSTTWLATWISVITMSMSPVAMGQEAQNITKQQVQSALDQLGLNKSSTVGQFYEKNKNIFPERIRKEIEPILANYKNVMMPEFQVTSATGPDGREIPNVTMSQAGQLINIQWFGTKDKLVKFQNTNLTEVDIINFTDMVSRILAGDAVLRKQNEMSQKQVSNQFTGLPVLDAATWKKMTMEERVSYIVQIRHLWLDAKNVLFEKNKLNKNKRTASTDILEKIFAIFAGVEAEAAGKAAAKATPTAFSKPASSFISGQSCLVAGYSANYNNGYCDHTKLLDTTYSKSPFVTGMNEKCSEKKSNDIACNPLIYGTPSGSPICITPERSNKQFQVATHFEGPCDTKSRLQSSGDAVKFLKDESNKKLVGRYDADNLSMTDEQRKEYFRKDQEKNGFAETKAFIEGVLKVNDPTLKDVFANGVLSDNVIEQLNGIQKLFNTEIEDATKACRAAANDKSAKHEANFIGACDQIQRRFLFISDLLKSKCKDGSTINSSTLKCTCSNQTEVAPGASCTATTPATSPPVVADPPGKDKPKDKPKDKGSCGPGEKEERVVGSNSKAEAVTCVPIKDKGKAPPAVAECGALCTIGKGLKFALPVILGAVGIYAMYKLFSPKKPALNPAADACPNGVVPPCGTVCPVPLANVNGLCACAACPPGQTLSSAATCTCSTTATTTTYTCWDNVTKVSDLGLCPQQKYTCWDGSTVTNSLNCPEKPDTTTTTTTTSGKTGR